MDNNFVDQRMEELFKIIEDEFVKIEQIFTKLEDNERETLNALASVRSHK